MAVIITNLIFMKNEIQHLYKHIEIYLLSQNKIQTVIYEFQVKHIKQ